MRVMVIVKATKNSEGGVMPSEKMLAEMGKFNEQLVKAGLDVDHWDVDWRRPVAILVGGEANGASDEARALAHRTVRIPMPGAMESLNAANAVAVLVFERLRQRDGRDGTSETRV